MNSYDVIIVGSGLAGVSCAIDLVEKKKKILIVEASPYVGGRTSSWNENGMWVESGLHRVLGFYNAFPRLLKKAEINMHDIIFWEDEIEIRLPDNGPKAVYGASILHKPLKTLGSMIGNSHMLSIKDKIKIAQFFLSGFKDYHLKPAQLDQQTVFDYAKKLNVNQKIIDRLLVPLTAGIFFLPPQEYSAFALFGVFAPFIPRLYKLRVGAFKGGMTEVMMQPIIEYIIKKGGEVKTNAKVENLIIKNGKVCGVQVGDKTFQAKAVVLATSLKPAQEIIKKSFIHHPWFSNMLKLPSMPAVTIQLELTHPCLPVDRTTFGATTALASFAEQSRTTFTHVPGRISIILSPPQKFLNMEPEKILKISKQEAKRLGFSIDHYTSYRIITRPHDFYSLTPKTEALKPTQKTPIPGLTLAGDYTKQKYLATMEGAVVSGEIAAREVLKQV